MTNTIRKCGRIVLEDTVKFAKEDAKQTGEDFRKLGAFVHDSYNFIANKPAMLLYPITGQLSTELNGRIEKAFGSNNYSAEDAFVTSALINMGLYPSILLGALNSYKPNFGVIGNSIFCLGLISSGILDSCARISYCHKHCYDNNVKYCASLPGKVVSMAITPAVRAYDYCKSVRERAKEKGK